MKIDTCKGEKKRGTHLCSLMLENLFPYYASGIFQNHSLTHIHIVVLCIIFLINYAVHRSVFFEFLTLWKCTGTLLCTRILSSPFHRRLAPRGIYIKQRNLMIKRKRNRNIDVAVLAPETRVKRSSSKGCYPAELYHSFWVERNHMVRDHISALLWRL